MTTPDEHARAFIAAEFTRALDRAKRRMAVCTCGAEYTPTADGRRVHRVLHGHTPTGGDAA